MKAQSATCPPRHSIINERNYIPTTNFFTRLLLELLTAALFFGVTLRTAHAQPRAFRFEHVPEVGILPWSVYQGSKGFLWIATWEGLYRYDGYTFKGYFHVTGDSTTISSNNVSRVFEDSEGTFWVQTYGTGRYVALHRFDPQTGIFTRITEGLDDLGGERARVRAFFEDQAGDLWLGTDIGLYRYDRPSQAFYPYAPAQGLLNSVAVRAIYEDDRSLWIGFAASGSNPGGLVRLDRDRNVHSIFQHDPHDPATIGAGGVNVLFSDSGGRLWVGTGEGGLCRMDRASGRFECYGYVEDDPTTISHHFVTTIEEDESRSLWVGTHSGLNRFDPETHTFTRFVYDAADPGNTAPGGDIEHIFRDRTGVLWISTWGGGLSKLSRPDPLFRTYVPPARHPMIGGAMMDRAGHVWVGSGDGLHRLDPRAGQWMSFRSDPGDPATISDNLAADIVEDSAGVFWIATFGGGLNRYDPRTGLFRAFRHDPHDMTTLSDDRLRSLYEDRSGRLWVGAWGGLNLFDRRTGRFVRFVHDPENPATIGSGIVGPIVEDQQGRIWAGTEIGGLSRMNAKDGTFKRYEADPSDPHSLNSDWIMALHQDGDGIFWVGTNDGGLNRFDEGTGRFTHFTRENSCLQSNRVMSVFEDREGYLWLNSGAGVVRFDREAHTCITYDARDGLFDERGYFNSSMTSDGEILFSAVGGIQTFNPELIATNAQPPVVVLTDLMLSRRSIRPEPDGPLVQDVAWTREVTLRHDQNDVAFEYAALHFVRPDRNRYMYMLEGYDEDWIDAGPQRTAAYTNLDPGRYTFRVKAANSDGVWNEGGTSLAMTILRPWWHTTWAYALYVLLAVGAIGVIDGLQRRRLVRRERARAHMRETELRAEALEAENRRKEIELEKARELHALNQRLQAQEERLRVQNRRLREMDEMKSRFFANVSHEFRTPLTLLLGPLEDALEDERRLDAAQMSMMRRAARRLLRLVGQLLDLSKLEAGSMQVRLHRGDVVEFAQRIVMAFTSRAEREQLTLSFSADPGEISWCFDAEKLEQVLANLLSNAFKFTPARGKIRVTVEEMTEDDARWLEITVRDTGEGINAHELPFIFDRFYQVDGTSTRRHGGTGIGLALSKELVEAHGGEIRVESLVGFGSTFVVRLPDVPNHEAVETPVSLPEGERFRCETALAETDDEATDDSAPADAPLILIVEDNADLRAYLRDRLGGRYRIEEAPDGAAGFEHARRLRPDLIVSDVMMPERDGFDVCRSVKRHPELNHIPVILLTARADEESALEGFEAGADDYLTKPFSASELLARAENLIELRRVLRARFSSELIVKPTDTPVPSADAAFIEKIREVVEVHLGDGDFGVEWLAGEVGVSTRHLHRKIRQLTGLSPVGFIRMMRLERAAQLLRRNTGSVSEVASAVGFSSTSYFSRLFKQAFGTTPSIFRPLRVHKSDRNSPQISHREMSRDIG